MYLIQLIQLPLSADAFQPYTTRTNGGLGIHWVFNGIFVPVKMKTTNLLFFTREAWSCSECVLLSNFSVALIHPNIVLVWKIPLQFTMAVSLRGAEKESESSA